MAINGPLWMWLKNTGTGDADLRYAVVHQLHREPEWIGNETSERGYKRRHSSLGAEGAGFNTIEQSYMDEQILEFSSWN